MTVEPRTMTVPDAGKMLGVSRGVAYQGVRDGSIPSIRIAGRIVVPRAKLLELLGEPSPDTREPAVAGSKALATTPSDGESSGTG